MNLSDEFNHISQDESTRRSLATSFLAKIGELLEENQSNQVDEDPPGVEITKPRQMFTHHQAHPLAIEAMLTKRFGRVWYVWEPETLRREIELEWKQATPSDVNWSKIQALRAMGRNKMPWVVWEAFLPVALAVNNRLPIPQMTVIPTIPQLYAAVDIISRFDPRFPLGDEIIRFMAAAFLDQGVTYAVEPLGFLQKPLQQPMYECLSCGNIDNDEDNSVCDVCFSSNLRRFNQNHLEDEDIQKIRDIVDGTYDGEIGEDRPGVIGARLKVATNYMKFRRKQLRQQLSMLEKMGEA